MPDTVLTLKDLAAREGTDDVVGLVEAVVNVAPEIERIPGRVIPGLWYTARVRKAINASRAFRKINQGVYLGASTYDQERFNTFAFDAQMQLDEALIAAAESEGDSAGKLMAEEASGAMRSKAIDLGYQFYQGTLNDANGCPGLTDFMVTAEQQLDSRTGAAIDQVVDAGGSVAGKCETAWFINEGVQGVHWLFGGGTGLRLNPWTWQYVFDTNNKHFRAMRANVFGFIGISCAHYHAVGAIRNIDAVTGLSNTTNATYALTDNMVAQLWAKFPIGFKPTACYATQKAVRSLQLSRSTTLFADAGRSGVENSGGAAPIAPWPTNLPTAGNIPIIPTDSIQPGNQMTTY
jgi:hypothetical protein